MFVVKIPFRVEGDVKKRLAKNREERYICTSIRFYQVLSLIIATVDGMNSGRRIKK